MFNRAMSMCISLCQAGAVQQCQLGKLKYFFYLLCRLQTCSIFTVYLCQTAFSCSLGDSLFRVGITVISLSTGRLLSLSATQFSKR